MNGHVWLTIGLLVTTADTPFQRGRAAKAQREPGHASPGRADERAHLRAVDEAVRKEVRGGMERLHVHGKDGGLAQSSEDLNQELEQLRQAREELAEVRRELADEAARLRAERPAERTGATWLDGGPDPAPSASDAGGAVHRDAEAPRESAAASPEPPLPPASALADQKAQVIGRTLKAMKPKAAAAIVERLPRALAAKAISTMPSRSAAAVLAQVQPSIAADLTQRLSPPPEEP